MSDMTDHESDAYDDLFRREAQNSKHQEEGNLCQCGGILGYEPVRDCSCHIVPLICLKCGEPAH